MHSQYIFQHEQIGSQYSALLLSGKMPVNSVNISPFTLFPGYEKTWFTMAPMPL
jgi:hypothetical protein